MDGEFSLVCLRFSAQSLLKGSYTPVAVTANGEQDRRRRVRKVPRGGSLGRFEVPPVADASGESDMTMHWSLH